MRLLLIDGSFIDVNISQKLKDRFSFHWECKNEDIFRYDNFPDRKAKPLKSYPYHFHYKSQDNIIEPEFPKKVEKGFRGFLDFVKKQIKKGKL